MFPQSLNFAFYLRFVHIPLWYSFLLLHYFSSCHQIMSVPCYLQSSLCWQKLVQAVPRETGKPLFTWYSLGSGWRDQDKWILLLEHMRYTSLVQGLSALEIRLTGVLISCTQSYVTITWSLRAVENRQHGSKVAVE